MSAVLNSSALVISSRVAFESTFQHRVRDLQTPSRLFALLHGVLCSVSLAEGNWHDAVQSTGLFFALDALLTKAIHKSIPLDTALHHAMGMALCLFSVVTKSYESSHVGSELTRALILMETSNPLLHLLVTLRKEGLDHKLPRVALQIIQAIFLLQFAGIRIGLLGHALFNMIKALDTATEFEIGMFWISLSMWLLQWMWFIKLVNARTK
jgi:hypothetical protein